MRALLIEDDSATAQSLELSIVTRLAAKLEAEKKDFAHLDMKSAMVGILAEAIKAMRELGADTYTRNAGLGAV
jgi:hypothetical protein